MNFDGIVVDCFDSHKDLKKRVPETAIGRRQFKTAKRFCQNNSLTKDVYVTPKESIPGPKVTTT